MPEEEVREPPDKTRGCVKSGRVKDVKNLSRKTGCLTCNQGEGNCGDIENGPRGEWVMRICKRVGGRKYPLEPERRGK